MCLDGDRKSDVLQYNFAAAVSLRKESKEELDDDEARWEAKFTWTELMEDMLVVESGGR